MKKLNTVYQKNIELIASFINK